MLDIDRNEIMVMIVHPTKNIMTSKFINEVLKHCNGTKILLIDVMVL